MMSMGQTPVMVQDLEMVRVQIYLRGTGCGVCMKKFPRQQMSYVDDSVMTIAYQIGSVYYNVFVQY